MDSELFDIGFIGLLQRAGVLKAIVSSRCLSNFWDLFNLRHLVTVTLEDLANQLLLPILRDVDPTTLELSPEEEAVEAEDRKSVV